MKRPRIILVGNLYPDQTTIGIHAAATADSIRKLPVMANPLSMSVVDNARATQPAPIVRVETMGKRTSKMARLVVESGSVLNKRS